jgi:hypothetical protein
VIILSILICFSILTNFFVIWVVFSIQGDCAQLNHATRMSLDRVVEKLWGEYGTRFFIDLERERLSDSSSDSID